MSIATLNDLLAEGKRSLTLFEGTAAIKAVDKLLSEKNGNYYVKCQVRDKDVLAKPEEIVRQLWIHRLIHHYHYPHGQIQVEYPITFGRDTSKRADARRKARSCLADSGRPPRRF